MDGTGPSMASRSMSKSSFLMETNPQHFIPDASSWHDTSSYICVSPQSLCNYQSDCTLEYPKDMVIKDAQRDSRRVRLKEQTAEVLLRRRAQNRASQRAYRERKDRRVTELETQLKEMGEHNQSLKRDHAELSAAYEKLKEEHARCREGKDGLENKEVELWRTETCLSLMLGEDAKELIEQGILVKAMICKR